MIDPAARIDGRTTALPAADWSGFGRVVRAVWMLGFLVAGAAAVLLFPGLAAGVLSSTREHAGASAAFGAAWMFGVPIVVVVAGATLIGLPLAALIAAVYLILLYLGRAAVALWLGDAIVHRSKAGARAAPVVSFLIGGALLLIIGLVPVIGPLVGFVATLVGVGAVLVAMWPRRQSQAVAS